MPILKEKEGIDVSVTLKLADKDAKLVAEGLITLSRYVDGIRDAPEVQRLRNKFQPWRVERLVEAFMRLSAAFQTAYEANQR